MTVNWDASLASIWGLNRVLMDNGFRGHCGDTSR